MLAERAADLEHEAHVAVTEERARMARELHDIVSHNLSVVVLQAAGARAAGASAGTLEKIERSGREALVEMRRLLGVLREDFTDASLTPQPGIADIHVLAASVRAAGVPVELEVDGDYGTLPPGVELSAYRIVQEALTNVLKHAKRAHAEVRVRRDGDVLTVEVLDDGAGDVRRRHRRARPRRDARTCRPLRRGTARRSAFGGRLRRPCDVAGRRMIRILLADDQDLVREGLRMLLEAEPDLEVVGEAADGKQALAEARRLEPDVLLMDVRMPELDGIEATARLAATGSRARILMLTTFDLDEYVYLALKAGASGFLLKDATREQLVGAVRTIAAGESLLAPAVTRRLIEDYCRGPKPGGPPDAVAALSERELEVLRLLARGLSNAEIAKELFLGEATVKSHVARVLAKLDLRDRVQTVVFAYESGLVRPGEAR